MNFLAHLLIADRVGADLAGAILGDFVHGPDLSRFDDDVAHSIRLHRRIDTITDQHPRVLAAIGRFEPGPRRYAPVILDVLMDYALGQDWPQYSQEPLNDFCLRTGAAVAAKGSLFPLMRRPTRGAFPALLRSYATETGIDFTLHRVAARLKKPQPMLDACTDWQQHVPALREDLPELLRDLETAARDFRSA